MDLVGSALAVFLVVFVVGIRVGLDLSASGFLGGSLLDWLSRYAGALSFLSSMVLAAITAVYVILTYRQSRAVEVQTKTALEALRVSQDQLKAMEAQLDLEYDPKIFCRTESLTGKRGSLELSDIGLGVHNFNRLPILIDYVRYTFKNRENEKLYVQTQLHEMSDWSGERLEPFDRLLLPLPKSVFGPEEPSLELYFYYGGTGSTRYRYSARVESLLGDVKEEKLEIKPKMGRFDF